MREKYNYESDREYQEYKDAYKLRSKIIRLCVIGAVGLFVLIQVILNIHIIKTNTTGVLQRMGQVQNEPLRPGIHFTIPFVERVTVVSNKQKDYEYDGTVWGESSEKTPVYAEGVSMTLAVNPEYSVYFVRNVENSDRNLVPSEVLSSALKNAMATLEAESVTNRAYIEPAAQVALQNMLDSRYEPGAVFVKRVTINQMDFEPEYNEAIAKRSQARIDKDTVEIENETSIKKAEADKKMTIINQEADSEKRRIEADAKAYETTKAAEAKAEAILKEAEAQSKANEMLSQSLTDNVLEQKYYEAWDGVLPQVVGESVNLTGIGMK